MGSGTAGDCLGLALRTFGGNGGGADAPKIVGCVKVVDLRAAGALGAADSELLWMACCIGASSARTSSH